MKHIIKLMGLLALVAFLGLADRTVERPGKIDVQSLHHTDRETVFSATLIKLHCHLPGTERIVNGFNHLPALGLKGPLYLFFGATKWIEQVFATEYAQYANFSINFLIQYRKADLIFPFHYFW